MGTRVANRSGRALAAVAVVACLGCQSKTPPEPASFAPGSTSEASAPASELRSDASSPLSSSLDPGVERPSFNAAEWRRVQSLTPQPAPPPSPTNAHADSPAAARLGQLLFFDPGYSGALASANDLGPRGARGVVACNSCHMSDRWFIDRRSIPAHGSRGTDHLRHRNAPSLVNVAYYRWSQWDGLFDSIWNQITVSPEHPEIQASNRARVVRWVAEHYREPYEAAFGPLPELSWLPDDAAPPYSVSVALAKRTELLPPWQALSREQQHTLDRVYAHFAKALEAYLRRLVSGPAPFDRFVAGDPDALSVSAQRGLKLFVGKAACHECHAGPMLSDAAWTGAGWPGGPGFHNLGLDQDPLAIESVADVDGGQGHALRPLRASSINPITAFGGTGEHSDDPAAGAAKLATLTEVDAQQRIGAFRTPSLRNVAETGPYMHNGYLATLEDVVRFYDRGGDTSGFLGERDRLVFALDLTEREIQDLVEFLHSLTGTPVPVGLLQDPGAELRAAPDSRPGT